MALGVVETIDDPANPVTGTVKEDITEDIFAFDDSNFPTTGLAVGSACTFDINFANGTPVASNLQAYVPTLTEITTPVAGPLTVNPGETLKVKNGGKVTGTIMINNGNLFVQGTGEVLGDVTVNNEGSLVSRQGGKVTGTIMINSGSALKVVNGGKVTGTIMIAKANRLIIGNNNGPGTIIGAITIEKIRKASITAASNINCP